MRLLGHPTHPPSVHLPLGLMLAVPIWDGLALMRVPGPWPPVAFWCLVAGLAFALPAMATGLVDFISLEWDHPAEAVAFRHMAVMSCAVVLFAASALVRRGGSPPALSRFHWAAGLGFAGAGVLSFGGWLGGELVYRFGVGRVK